MMTALVTALALVPLVVWGDRPGHELENPMVIVILGGLASSTLLNLFLMPALYLRYGRRGRRERRYSRPYMAVINCRSASASLALSTPSLSPSRALLMVRI